MTEPTQSATEAVADVSPSPVDWSVLDEPGVTDVLDMAARKVGEVHGSVTTGDDMRQEGAIWLASNANQVRSYLSNPMLGERALYNRLRSRLLNVVLDDPHWQPSRLGALPEPPE